MNNNKEKKIKSRNKKTGSARNAKEHALEKIEGNIKKIYTMPGLQESLIDIRGYLRIKPPSKAEMEEINKIRSIKKIIELLKNNWLNRIYKNKEMAKIIGACHARVSTSLEMDELHDKIKAARTKNEISEIREMEGKYLKGVINSFLYSNYNHIYEKHKVNSKIWKHVLAAMLFDVPEATVLRVKESIMPDYMPKINENLQIQINELTRMGEITAIINKIKAAQKRYKDKYKYQNFERKRKN